MNFKHDKIEEIELLHTEALADRLQFLALRERNPIVSLWLSHSADRLQIQLEDNADLERQLAAARRDSERLLKVARLGLEFAEDELANLKVACKGYPDRYRYEEQLVAEMRQAIDAAIRDSQTRDEASPPAAG